jgi:MFS family permease
MMLRIREHHLQLPFWHVDTGRNMNVLYAIRVIRDLVNKLALFFFPIFLFQLGSVAPEFAGLALTSFQKGMIVIAGYYFLAQLTVLITALPLGKLLPKLTHERSFIFSYLVRAVVFSLLLFNQEYLWMLAIAAVLDGVQSNLFWNSYHTILSRVTQKKHMGQDLGILQFLLQLVAVLSPALAGLVARYLGIDILFLVALVLSLVGAILSLFLELRPEFDVVSKLEFFKWMKEGAFRKLSLSFAGRYVNDAALLMWPLYIYFLLGAIDRVGYLYSLSLFLSLVATFFIGTYIDAHRKKNPLFASGGILSFLWLARTQVWGVWSIAVVDVFDRLVSNVHWLYFDTAFIRRGKGSQALSYFIYREIVISFVGVLFWLLFGLVFIFSAGWNTLFVLAAVGVLLSSIITEYKE